MAATSRVDAILPTAEPIRPLANFPPSIWGDRFLSFSLDTSQVEAYINAMEEPIEQLKKFLSSPTIDSNEKLNLIYSMYHLGMTYLFSKEIEGQLDILFNQLNLKDYDEVDLYTISIHFQVFRNFGYRFPCDVFNKFKDFSSGEFKKDIATDVKGMISFYESAHLRIRGESILDEAIVFAETNLKTIEKSLQGILAQRVKRVLDRSFYRGHQMVEARLYFLDYEEDICRYEMLPKLAKVYFNYLQLLQKEELQIVSKWWKDLSCRTKSSYVRDRVPECYIWISTLFLEPYYSHARIITTKVILFVCFLDDTYDAYATIEENRLLTQAIQRWDISALSELPEYIKPFYKILLNEYSQFNKQFSSRVATNVIDASKRACQDLAKGYLQETEWIHNGVVPSFEEYMKTGLVTSTYGLILNTALIGMGDIVTQEALAWYESHPKMIKAVQIIGRLEDDIVSVKFERERSPTATSVDTYMKSFGVLENVAIEALKKNVENAWKDINEACLKPTEIPIDLLAPIVYLARMNNVAYKYKDAFTFPENTFKEYISLLFFDQVPM